MTVKRVFWWLPRPRMPYYKGGFPLHFEVKFFREFIGMDFKNSLILQPFGGKSEYGIRLDVNKKTLPTIVADAHHLPFKDNVFDCILIDPPYSDELSKSLYNTGKLRRSVFVKDAVRCLKVNGVLGLYHIYLQPRPNKCKFECVLFILTRVFHHGRIVSIFRKNEV